MNGNDIGIAHISTNLTTHNLFIAPIYKCIAIMTQYVLITPTNCIKIVEKSPQAGLIYGKNLRLFIEKNDITVAKGGAYFKLADYTVQIQLY